MSCTTGVLVLSKHPGVECCGTDSRLQEMSNNVQQPCVDLWDLPVSVICRFWRLHPHKGPAGDVLSAANEEVWSDMAAAIKSLNPSYVHASWPGLEHPQNRIETDCSKQWGQLRKSLVLSIVPQITVFFKNLEMGRENHLIITHNLFSNPNCTRMTRNSLSSHDSTIVNHFIMQHRGHHLHSGAFSWWANDEWSKITLCAATLRYFKSYLQDRLLQMSSFMQTLKKLLMILKILWRLHKLVWKLHIARRQFCILITVCWKGFLFFGNWLLILHVICHTHPHPNTG